MPNTSVSMPLNQMVAVQQSGGDIPSRGGQGLICPSRDTWIKPIAFEALNSHCDRWWRHIQPPPREGRGDDGQTPSLSASAIAFR